ncbi:multisubunit sodium/proton antiporter, MrpA subunit /multisubunit sodium/proton antiporter, MrpB subunit [Georgenia satyanarayanai]|uniref:Multisubunit sodium/proton antiporter, MrpA subunit /multisubunit sodium/proton antiporter, MrpB subunit n=1 Tax=Georgenia satyanarayanai TaxID=860221 RepID=A0A2Y9ANR2_9MICO|nr:Na+/H+ antiporter subunit A [Georgenia satyanarayanai]PYF99075.1 multisubunit sodium/proton antiporter MrpA subunit /multisubunit sodium/proton antiporter MrpB subunit [Georgenia satyanarayanai]SSA44037.1 multisubunit sodium/proton antiporter, MrpA subunit /multisubunit sodium/proton antiporter, MrpB subunit [Georgenia satyanarayanai]
MLQLLILHLVVAVVAPACMRLWGRRFFLVLALVPASAAAWAAAHSPAVLRGDHPVVDVSWVPALDLHLTFRLDTLAWLMVLLVGGIGGLVLVYCAAYFSATAQGLGRFAGVFVAFAGSMLGLVTTDNTLLLYVFWELTTVTSFLLIGHYHDRQSSRRAAVQALVLTTFGGLAMLAGFIALGEAEGGSYSLSTLVASPPGGTLVEVAVALVLLGAVTKSALLPFHFWLPSAMAAPTPVSAYLHAAAMVKAGVYLVARLAPGFADVPLWRWAVLVLGGGTLLLGGYRSLRQHDLKLLLAFGTVSQLGFIILLVGFGTRATALAGLALITAHALFKASLFLVVGTIDWAVGTRDLRELTGLTRRMPLTAASAALATASMVGLPVTLGYVAKEAALESMLHTDDGLGTAALVLVVLGSVLTFAYGMRFMWGAFASKPGVELSSAQRTSRLIVTPAAVLAVAGVVVGCVPGGVEHLLAPHADAYPGEPGHLILWGGFGPALYLTLLVIGVGTVLFLWRAPVERLQGALWEFDGAAGVYKRIIRGTERFAADVTAFTQRGSLPAYLSTILTVTIALGGGAALAFGTLPAEVRPWDSGVQAAVAAVVALASLLAARARRRLKAVLLLGVSGYGIALLYELHGAPDLALTQVLVETITLVVFILVLRRLPAYFSNRPLAASRWWRAALGALVGIAAAGLTMVAAGSRVHAPVSVDFAEEAYEYGYGRNVVNVTLVDIRAWDTMGEISVLLAAATGVASLIFLRARAIKIDRATKLEDPQQARVWETPVPDRNVSLYRRLTERGEEAGPEGRGRQWLSAIPTLAPQRRSVIFEVGTRLVFHTMVLFSLYLLFAGHNQPGGGFAGGLIAGVALTVRYLAGGRYELGEALPVQAGWVLGSGLFLSAGAGAIPLFFGGDVLQSTVIEASLGPMGELKLVTTLFFDIGVYLVVVGLVLDILRTLGAEVDRQGEREGDVAPDVPFDSPEVTADDAAPEAAPAGWVAGPRPGGSR